MEGYFQILLWRAVSIFSSGELCQFPPRTAVSMSSIDYCFKILLHRSFKVILWLFRDPLLEEASRSSKERLLQNN